MRLLTFLVLFAGCGPGTTADNPCRGGDCKEPDVTECTDGVDCPEDCTDAVDNDGDGLDNCEDDDCLATCDADGDGFIDQAQGGDDCDDTNASVYPEAPEVCDGVDNDCNDLADFDDPDLDPNSVLTYYRDGDADGYGTPTDTVIGCEPPSGYVDNSEDCSDNDPDRSPDALEVCNGFDDNCDGLTDDSDPTVDVTTGETFYADTDGDGDGDALAPLDACDLPAGYSPISTDCDDTDRELEGRDRDGDGFSTCDNDCDDMDAAMEPADGDGDGVSLCDGDCDDTDGTLSPLIDVDNDNADSCVDCDDDDPLLNLDDMDLDGWTTCDLDCDDNDGLVEPADLDGDGISTCDGDCDDNDAWFGLLGYWVPDADGDGFGVGAPIGPASCTPPGPNYAPESYPLDCDDSDPAFSPGAIDVCGDGIDHDCDLEDCVIFIEDFETLIDVPWQTWGAATWFTQAVVAQEGLSGGECGNIGNSQNSFLGIGMDFPADGEVSFWHTGETEYSYDFLEFRMDGLLLLSASGYWAWQFDSFPVTAGYHAFEWRYSKDGSVSDGADTVWLDDIQMPGANP